MKSSLKRSGLIVQKSSIHGYGVFAAEDILADETIEECYYIPIKKESMDLESFYFETGSNQLLLALGYGSIYNHAELPNATYYYDPDEDILIFQAARSIKAGEEILVSYGEKWFSTRKLRAKNPSWAYVKRRFLAFLPSMVRFTLVMTFLFLILKFFTN